MSDVKNVREYKTSSWQIQKYLGIQNYVQVFQKQFNKEFSNSNIVHELKMFKNWKYVCKFKKYSQFNRC